ncbi:MAG: 5-(carboxyamino)imidazole ribonucleotide synthase [Pseudomonadota bacterium]
MKIGIIGGGQLAKMMILAGYPLGQEFVVLDPSPEAAGGRVANRHIIGDYDDSEKLRELAGSCDLVTFDFENVPAAALADLEQQVAVYPPSAALRAAQDRLEEKALFESQGIPTAPHRAVDSESDLKTAVEAIGLPGILKTRRLGYDGKGQFVLRSKEQMTEAMAAMNGQAAIYEGMVPFDCELSLLSVRGRAGETEFYPLATNDHIGGILHISRVPYASEALQKQAQKLITPLLEKLDYVGVLAVEFFLVGDELIANEMAPRVHNSGHWSIEGAICSQFENHLRAITGLPLGSTRVDGYAAMVNCISQMPLAEDVLKISDCHFHDYGKAPKAKRKLGHVTTTSPSKEQLEEKLALIERVIETARNQ